MWLETFPEMSTFIDSKNAVPKHLDGSKIICPRKLVDNSTCASVNKKLPRSKACMKCLNWCFHKSVSVSRKKISKSIGDYKYLQVNHRICEY